MSLLDDPPDTLLLYREVQSTDEFGNHVRVPGASPTRVRGRLQPLSSEESAALGQELATMYRWISRDWPKGGAFAHAEIQGRRWDIQGEPMRHEGSPTTRHVTVYLRARAPEVL